MQIGEKIKIIRENKKMLTHAMCFISLIMTNLQKRGNWQKTPVSTPRALSPRTPIKLNQLDRET
ncbi:hypothetical protein [Pediococcus pentosaceus]|jgi:hypothetical protein|uniref:hypothetical protein n=1 Tax=Pediococcus pentosaceus TaxID=1255 RepID=UPI0010092DEA|nr:hypothetical protein [Pediococcus pentosaceus]MEC5141875.1 hypothetical protein [Pediococcus pentosaceus]RXI20933.1 hypothetical protein EPT61_08955 [Pediococcus pentosaceus]